MRKPFLFCFGVAAVFWAAAIGGLAILLRYFGNRGDFVHFGLFAVPILLAFAAIVFGIIKFKRRT